jgi:hypothetical protein
MIELPSLSKEFDKFGWTGEIVPGEVTSSGGHIVAMFALKMNEYHNTPPTDLWDFYIKPALKSMASKLNEYADKVCVRTPSLPPDNAVVAAAFISADGRIPFRMMVIHRGPTDSMPEDHMLFTIDILTQKVD